jgi:hypothetical protein
MLVVGHRKAIQILRIHRHHRHHQREDYQAPMPYVTFVVEFQVGPIERLVTEVAKMKKKKKVHHLSKTFILESFSYSRTHRS